MKPAARAAVKDWQHESQPLLAGRSPLLRQLRCLPRQLQCLLRQLQCLPRQLQCLPLLLLSYSMPSGHCMVFSSMMPNHTPYALVEAVHDCADVGHAEPLDFGEVHYQPVRSINQSIDRSERQGPLSICFMRT